MSEADPYGIDREFITGRAGKVLGFLHNRYWRVEVAGLEHVPAEGPVVLTGTHRNMMPFDAMMALYELTGIGRIPRFLVDPALLKTPKLGKVVSGLGGIPASREGAAWVLEQGEILGMYPEAAKGAFAEYRDTYRLHSFGRSNYISFALAHRAPILPFVTVGSAEAYPILKLLHWKWFKKRTGWPGLPITPTFPFVS